LFEQKFLPFLSASAEHATGFVAFDSKEEKADYSHSLVHRHAWPDKVYIVDYLFGSFEILPRLLSVVRRHRTHDAFPSRTLRFVVRLTWNASIFGQHASMEDANPKAILSNVT
jgi:hypothetical protein